MRQTDAFASNIAQFFVFKSPEMKKKRKKLKKSWNIFHFGLDFLKKWEYITKFRQNSRIIFAILVFHNI